MLALKGSYQDDLDDSCSDTISLTGVTQECKPRSIAECFGSDKVMLSRSGRSFNKQFVCFQEQQERGHPVESISLHDSRLVKDLAYQK